MDIRFIGQPTQQFGILIDQVLDGSVEVPSELVLVSAWVSRQALLRYRSRILTHRDAGAAIRLVTGVDLGGTSQEALQEVLSWQIDAWVLSDRRPRHTFHPKMTLAVRGARVDLLIGSSNFTDGGLYTNFEAGLHCVMHLPDDQAVLDDLRAAYGAFLNPSAPTGMALSQALIDTLVARGELPTENERAGDRTDQRNRRAARRRGPLPPSPFGTQEFDQPPPLPADVVAELARSASRTRSTVPARGQTAALSTVQLNPVSFYMTLAAIGPGIPGEQRVPLAARDIALDFWEWDGSYADLTGRTRQYKEWRPTWRVRNAASNAAPWEGPVRMYFYPASSDFRFHSGELIQLGAQAGDIVRITKVSENPTTYECVLARQGTTTYAEWISYCTETVQNSTRQWGYA